MFRRVHKITASKLVRITERNAPLRSSCWRLWNGTHPVQDQGSQGTGGHPTALCAPWPCIQPSRVLKTWDLLTIEDNNHFFLAPKWSHILQLPCAHLTTDGKILKDFDP